MSETIVTRLSNGEVCFLWPVAVHRITAGWTYSDGSAHGALDFGIAEGSPVFAVEDGTVDQVQYWDGKSKGGMQSYGNMIRIKHQPYKSRILQTRYAHLKTICVKNGQAVKTGDVIGNSGNTGNSTGPHLHFEVRFNNAKVNPLNWFDNDFYTANARVRLGSYKSVVRERTAEIREKPKKIEYYPVYTGNTVSIVVALKAVGVDSSYDHRAKIAAANGIVNYSGTAAQNTAMLKLLKTGKLVKE